MSKLLDRYLAAIHRELPQRHADEITAELKDALLSTIEDREADRGRPLTDREIEQVLIDFGHPLIVAGRYRRTQYLIGPELFPMWFATLRFVLAFGGAIMLIGLVVSALTTNASPLWVMERIGQSFWPAFLGAFAIVTLVFAVNERMGRYRFKLTFDPRHLPPPRAKYRKPPQIISEIVLGGVALLWWAGVIRFRALMPIPEFLDVRLASTWEPLRGAVAAYLVAEMFINGLELLRPSWVRLVAGLGLAKAIAGCAIMVVVLQAGHWVEVGAPTLSPEAREMIQQGFDKGLHIGLVVTTVVMAFKAVGEALRLWRSLHGDGGHAGNGAAAAAA